MKKIVFKSGKELEIDGITQSGSGLRITVFADDVDNLIKTFENPENTSVMRYYVGIDLICGYAGFKKFVNLEYTPNVVKSINYEQEDETTESGFAETHVNVCVVNLEKVATTELPDGLTDKVEKLENDVTEIKADMSEVTAILEGN